MPRPKHARFSHVEVIEIVKSDSEETSNSERSETHFTENESKKRKSPKDVTENAEQEGKAAAVDVQSVQETSVDEASNTKVIGKANKIKLPDVDAVDTPVHSQALGPAAIGEDEVSTSNMISDKRTGFNQSPLRVELEDGSSEPSSPRIIQNETGAQLVDNTHRQASDTVHSPETVRIEYDDNNLSIIPILAERIADAASQTMAGFYDFNRWQSLKAAAEKLVTDIDTLVESTLASSGAGDTVAAATAATDEVNCLIELLSYNNLSLAVAQIPKLGVLQTRLGKLRPTTNKRPNVRTQSLSSKLLPTVLKLGEIIDCFLENGDSGSHRAVETTKGSADSGELTPSMEGGFGPSGARLSIGSTVSSDAGDVYNLAYMVSMCAGLILSIAVTLGYITPSSFKLGWSQTHAHKW